MKMISRITLALILAAGLTTQAAALSLYVDTAPNVFGSPDYAPWEDAAFHGASNGTFVNMANSFNPANAGTTDFEIQDEVVYSFGDLGKRLTWIYWIPNETVSDLSGTGRFSVKLENYWDGDFMDFYFDYYGTTWLEPSKWKDYDSDGDGAVDGVIGAAGMAWWGANGVNTPEALAADIAAWSSVDETWIFTARLDGVETSITSHRDAVVPEPGTMLLLGTGLVGLAAYGRKRRSA